MKKNYNLDDFENFLSDSAEQHRMYPSDKVWRNIDQELHGNKKWPALTFGAILTGAIITAGLILIHPDKSLFTVNTPPEISQPATTQIKSSNNTIMSPGIASRSTRTIDEVKKDRSGFSSTSPYYADVNIESASEAALATSSTDLAASRDGFPGNGLSAESDNTGILASGNTIDVAAEEENNSNANYSIHAFERVVRTDHEANNELKAGLLIPDLKTGENNYQKAADHPVDKIAAKTNRWSFSVYATPSISYRYLSEAKFVDLHTQQNSGPLAPNLIHGVSDFVDHKPIMGFEIGGGMLYSASPSFRLKAGLQFNSRGYSIDAYASKREVSTILLNRGYYTDSLIGISSISTQEGYKPMVLHNRYFEISIPLGMDMRVVNWKKIQLFVGAGVQPTYQFNQSMYMISSDYKKYIQEPELARHFNINTSFEAFMSYKTGGVTWQAGPQIRYQLLPGAINDYPVRERLIDYGFKIGVVKTLK